MKSRRAAMVAYTEYARDPRVRRFAECLIRNGYEVDCFVLKETNNIQVDVLNGVKIFHLKTRQYRGNSNLTYIYSYFTFFIQALIALTKKIHNNYSVIHVHNMPDFLVFTTLINKLFGSKVILDIHDNMPELYKAKFDSKIGILLYHILLAQERLSCFYVDRIITVHIPILKYNIKHHHLNLEKSFVISNFADSRLFKNNCTKNIGNQKKIFKLIYHGTISDRFGLNLVLNGIKIVVKSNPNIKMNIYGNGDGVKSLLQNIKRLNLFEYVEYHGQIELDKIPEKIKQSDLGIVPYIQSDATELMLPLKLMEYIAMGIPSLTVRNIPIKYYFKKDELAYYESNNLESFTHALLKLIKSPTELYRLEKKTKNINKRLNWKNEQIKYINEILTLTGTK